VRAWKIAALDDRAELVGSVGLRKLALEIKVAPSWLSEQLKVRRDPEIVPALEDGHISVAQAAALARAPAHARRNLLDRTVREHPEFRQVRQWVDEVRLAEKATRAEIGVSLATLDRGLEGGNSRRTVTNEERNFRFEGVLAALRSAGEPTTDQDLEVLTAIGELCARMLSSFESSQANSNPLDGSRLETIVGHRKRRDPALITH
jgi:hypothetical protein